MWITLFSLFFLQAAYAMESTHTIVWSMALDSAVAEILPDFSQSEKEERMLLAYRLVHIHKLRSVSTSGRLIKKQYMYEEAWAFLTELYRSELANRDHLLLNGWLAKKDDSEMGALGEKIAQSIIHYSSKQ